MSFGVHLVDEQAIATKHIQVVTSERQRLYPTRRQGQDSAHTTVMICHLHTHRCGDIEIALRVKCHIACLLLRTVAQVMQIIEWLAI